jgi:hypothetical protein
VSLSEDKGRACTLFYVTLANTALNHQRSPDSRHEEFDGNHCEDRLVQPYISVEHFATMLACLHGILVPFETVAIEPSRVREQ